MNMLSSNTGIPKSLNNFSFPLSLSLSLSLSLDVRVGLKKDLLKKGNFHGNTPKHIKLTRLQ
jgi:hypothetical protein